MLFCLTANHRNTDFDVLDRLAGSVLPDTASVLAADPRVRGAVVLSTCNRFEAYLDIDGDGTADAHATVTSVLREHMGPSADELVATASAYEGQEAIRHLFTVSSGLESMVIGEEEISGQVQRALSAARDAGTTSSALEQVFQRAATTTREVRAKADMAASGRTLARVALDMLESRIADWSTRSVLIVGTGSYAATTIQALRSRGATDVRVFSATGRAALFANRYGITPEPTLPEAIADADVVITCTARYTVTADQIVDDRPRFIVDLGLPRNVEPAVGAMPGVELLDLELIGRHASVPALADGAHELVGTALSAFVAERASAPAIVAWRAYVQEIADGEFERLRKNGEDARAEEALRHFAGVLAHAPSVRAREFAAAGRLDEFTSALHVVFGIDVPAALVAREDDAAAS